MVDRRRRQCCGAGAPAREQEAWAGRNRKDRENRAAAGALVLAGLPYFPFRRDTLEPAKLVLLGAAFPLPAWRIHRRS